MGFLDQIGNGLREGAMVMAAGGSNEVFREQGQNIARRKEHEQNRQTKAAEIMLQAAHSGQIPEDKLPQLQQSLLRMGYDLPIEALRATPEARQKLSEYARIKSEREQAELAGNELANFGQTSGLGLPEQGLRGNAPAPLPGASLGLQVPMPPRPQGMPPDQPANPPGVQTFPLAPPDTQTGTPSPEQPFSQDQQDRIADTEALSDNPDYPPEIIPPGAPVSMRQGEVAQLEPVEVIGRRPGPQEVSRGTIPSIVQNEIAQAIPSGTSKVDLQEWYKKAMIASQRGVPGAKDVLEHVLKLMNPALTNKTHVIDGSLVDDSGRVIYKGTPEQIKAVQEYNAILDQGGITDPAERQAAWREFARRKGSGVTVNTGQPKAPTGFRYSEDGTRLEQIKGGPADELDAKQKAIVIGTQNTKNAIKEYREKVKGMSTLEFYTPNSKALLETDYAAMLLLAKEAFNLGVLNPNDRVIMEEIIKNTVNWKSALLTKETLDKQAATLDKMMDIMARNASEVRPQDALANGAAGKPTATLTKPVPPGNVNGQDIPSTIERANKAISGGGNAAGIKNKLLKLGFSKQILDEYLAGPK